MRIGRDGETQIQITVYSTWKKLTLLRKIKYETGIPVTTLIREGIEMVLKKWGMK